MAKFDAGKSVQRLDYDFQKFGGPVGYIEEPSSDQVSDFIYGMSTLLEDVAGETVDPTDNRAMAAIMSRIYRDRDLLDEVNLKSAELVAALASNDHPDGRKSEITEDMLNELPARVQQAFYGWLQGELNPNGSTPAGRN